MMLISAYVVVLLTVTLERNVPHILSTTKNPSPKFMVGTAW